MLLPLDCQQLLLGVANHHPMRSVLKPEGAVSREVDAIKEDMEASLPESPATCPRSEVRRTMRETTREMKTSGRERDIGISRSHQTFRGRKIQEFHDIFLCVAYKINILNRISKFYLSLRTWGGCRRRNNLLCLLPSMSSWGSKAGRAQPGTSSSPETVVFT